MKRKLFLTLLLTAIIPAFMSAQTPNLGNPWDKGGFETGQYRNMFAEMGYSQEAIDAKLQEVFNDVFFGPDKCYFEVGDDMAYISDIKNFDVRTEGMSYGLMIAVQFDRKDIFDKLWRWCVKYMQHHDGPLEGYFAWSCNTDGTRRAQGPASDGELYYVTALIFASNLWGNDTGIDYLAEAQKIINLSFQKYGLDEGAAPLINLEHKLITFTPEPSGYYFTDPSYHIPAFYEVWAKWLGDGRSKFWMECAKTSREYLQKSCHPVTGLNPDHNNYDGTPISRFGSKPSFRYDSWRVPMNIALDYSWSCADKEWQNEYGNKIQNFFESKGIYTFEDQYSIDGTPVQDTLWAGGKKALRHSIGLIGTTAAVSMVSDNEHRAEFIKQLWEAKHVPFEDGYFDAYYDGLLRLFAFMHLSGNYKIIPPAQ